MTRAVVLYFGKSQDNLKYQTFAKSCRENSENILFSAMDHRQGFCSSLSESPNAFLKSSPVNPPEDAMLKIRRPAYKRLSKLHATCRPKRWCQSKLSTDSVLANRSLHQNLMHSRCRGMAVQKVCLQAFPLFPLPSSPRVVFQVRHLEGQVFCKCSIQRHYR